FALHSCSSRYCLSSCASHHIDHPIWTFVASCEIQLESLQVVEVALKLPPHLLVPHSHLVVLLPVSRLAHAARQIVCVESQPYLCQPIPIYVTSRLFVELVRYKG